MQHLPDARAGADVALRSRAAGFPPKLDVSLVWGTQAGNRVSGSGFAPQEVELTRLTIGRDGPIQCAAERFRTTLAAFTRSLVRNRRHSRWRGAYFVIETSIVSISPTSGPPAHLSSIHLKGVGWTDFDNIYVATYDNALHGLRLRIQQPGRRRRQLHGGRLAWCSPDRLLSRASIRDPTAASSCIACLSSPTPTTTPATRFPRCDLRSL